MPAAIQPDGMEVFDTSDDDLHDNIVPGDFRWRRTYNDGSDREPLLSDTYPSFDAAMDGAVAENADCVRLVEVSTADGGTRKAMEAV